MTEAERVDRYLGRAERYWRNASQALEKGEADKAGEYIWGTIALVLKAVALHQIRSRIRSHQGLRRFAEALAKRYSDPDLVKSFDSAEVLHVNFYEAEHTLEDVRVRMDTLRPFLNRLLRLTRTPAS